MKKTYMNPELEVVKIATHQILAASTLGIDASVEITDESDLLSREFDGDLEEDFDDLDEEDL